MDPVDLVFPVNEPCLDERGPAFKPDRQEEREEVAILVEAIRRPVDMP
jgi:hypothetical protein